MKRSTNASKLDQIKSGGITKKQIGGNATQKTFQSKGGKFTITETSKKFEEAGVAKKKRNYVMFQSKLGTEKEQNLTMHQQPSVKPRNNEKIIQTKFQLLLIEEKEILLEVLMKQKHSKNNL